MKTAERPSVAASDTNVAYFSMEIGLDPAMPTYSGGLGILAGDTLRSAADLKLAMVGMTLLHRKGYFFQRLRPDGTQIEQPAEWPINDFLEPLPERVAVELAGKNVTIAAWRGFVKGTSGFVLPVLFMDTDLDGNDEWSRGLTSFLYGGDARYRLGQEAVLGIGGVRMLRTLGHTGLTRFHMNEGHSSLLVLELLEESMRAAGRDRILPVDFDVLHKRCVFTTHTPVPAGHDQFPMDLVTKLDDAVFPMFISDRRGYINVMRQAIALNGSFFNTHRMVLQYVANAYFG